ncbi:type IV pilin protein [Ideonella livida]|uniref:Prepilin-type N-terminal cleavage/methylation domain-containing protein n=1 Tax=Ideonella livida TaxID=2707176 RepID=A0A7C9TLM1_9BURK|nr:type IV pilin protein [Ideonella livida]NDY93640.1 prepilin-type N-terminal cleavage/methylation domain-containing protein [Ideonella livida]
MKNRAFAGFTLLELMVVVAIVGILAMVAVPSYQSSVIKGRRSAAQAQMVELSLREQQFLSTSRSYADKDTLEAAGYRLPSDVSPYYTYDVTTETSPPGFVITFTPVTTSPQKDDGALTLNQAGTRTPAAKW